MLHPNRVIIEKFEYFEPFLVPLFGAPIQSGVPYDARFGALTLEVI